MLLSHIIGACCHISHNSLTIPVLTECKGILHRLTRLSLTYIQLQKLLTRRLRLIVCCMMHNSRRTNHLSGYIFLIFILISRLIYSLDLLLIDTDRLLIVISVPLIEIFVNLIKELTFLLSTIDSVESILI